MTGWVVKRVGVLLRRAGIRHPETAYLLGWMNGTLFGATFVIGFWVVVTYWPGGG